MTKTIRKNVDYELKKGIVYTCSFKNFDTEHYDWDKEVVMMFHNNVTYSRLFKKIEFLQGGRDDDGFYPNYLRMLVDPEDCNFDVDGLLEAHGFGFNKREITYANLLVDWDESINDYLVEEC